MRHAQEDLGEDLERRLFAGQTNEARVRDPSHTSDSMEGNIPSAIQPVAKRSFE